jgi:hypothetical protein
MTLGHRLGILKKLAHSCGVKADREIAEARMIE